MSGSDLYVGGELLGYRVEGLLGRGGMGVVYLAEDTRLRRRVALKLLAPSLAGNQGFRERFLAESKLAASLDHPCVVPIYEAGEHAGRLFIAMRYVAGSDLKALLRNGPLSAERTVAVCAQVADALDFAHSRALVHRDVKPSNVLLDGRDHVYLADFGLTKRVGDLHAVEPGVLGTIDYVAPEQIRGEKIDGRADQYSLGCLFYECLVGEPPFARPTDAAVLFAHLEEQPPALQGLESVMDRALAKEPAGRYSTCTEFVDAAGHALGVGARARSPERSGGAVCPFKGLAFFDRSDTAFFCGRERVVSEIVARLAASTVVGILGPSGIGKSSLLRAGVLPALSAGALPGSAGWRQVVMRPGEQPCRELTRVLGGQRLEAALAGLAPGSRIVVAIDQLEELFTTCDRESERSVFIDQLGAAARDHGSRVLVVASLRADFYGRFASYPGFAELLSSSHVLVGPMGRSELAQAIAEPAARAGLEVEPPLLQALVSDVADQPGGLPLLSTMLLELWQARDGHTLRYESYRSSGGIRGAVARLAERAFVELDDGGRAVARTVMLRLVSDEDGVLVRRRVPLSELHQVAGAEPVVTRLTDARLLTVNDGDIEVSHEALLHEWPRYRDWLAEDTVGRRLHAHLATTARDWDAHGRDPGDLYRGARLTGAHDWAAQHRDLMTALERGFLTASDEEAQSEARHQRARTRRLRGMLLAVAVLLVIAVAVGIVALTQKQHADSAARAALGRELSVEALSEPRIDKALLLARQAVRFDRAPETESALLATLQRSPAVIGTFALPVDARLDQLAVSPDGRTVAVGDDRGELGLYRTGTNELQRPPPTDYLRTGGRSLAYSSDGSLLAYPVRSASPSIAIRDARTLRLLHRIRGGQPGQPETILFAPDRSVLFGVYSVPRLRRNHVGFADYVARWSLPSGRRLMTMAIGTGRLLAARLTNGGSHLVVLTSARAVVRDGRSLRELRSVAIAPRPAHPTAGAISPGGRTAAVGSQSGIVSFVNLATGRAYRGNKRHDHFVHDVVYSPDGRSVATTAGEDRLMMWNPDTGSSTATLTGPPGENSLVFTPDGKTLYTSSDDGVVVEWDLAGDRQLGRRFALRSAGRECCIPSTHPFVFSPDRTQFAVRTDVSTVGLFATHTLQRVTSFTLQPGGGQIVALAWTAAGDEIATAAVSGVVQLWTVSGVPRPVRSPVRLQSLKDGRYGIPFAAFSPDGQLLAGCDGAVVAIWNVSSGRLIARQRSGTSCYGLTFSADGQRLAAATTGDRGSAAVSGRVLVLDAKTGRIQQTLGNTGGEPLTLAFAPDGTLAAGSSEGTVELWNAATGRRIAAPAVVGGGAVVSIAVDPRGKRLATITLDGTVKLWFVPTLERDGNALNAQPITDSGAAFEPGGNTLFVYDDQGGGFSWPVSLGVWQQRACAIAGRSLTRQEWTRYVPARAYTRVCP